MLDYIELNNENHFFDGEWLYINIKNNVYRYLIKPYKELQRSNRAYILSYHDEFTEYHLAFYDKKVRDLFQLLLTINSIGMKTIEAIIKELTVDEFYELVKHFNYDRLMKIKGFGLISSKNIVDQTHKKLFELKLTSRDEEIIKTLTKLGYSRKSILKNWTKVDHQLNQEEFMHQLIILLGREKDDLPTS